MQVTNATAPEGGGIVGLDATAKVVAQILGSQDPEEMLLTVIIDGSIPGNIGLELAEVFGKLIKVSDLENLVGVVTALTRGGKISSHTEQALFLAIIKIAEQVEAGQPEVGDTLMGVSSALTPATPSESPLPAPTQAPTPTVNLTDLVRSASELQHQFGSAVPAEQLAEIHKMVDGLAPEAFASLRQSISSAILAQAELDEDGDVTRDLEVLGILFGKRQAELTAAVFAIYETLSNEGFRLRDRDGYDRPLMTVSSIKLFRDRFRRLLDSRESSLTENILLTAEKAVGKLEEFLLIAGHDSVRESISADIDARLRERIVSLGIRVHNAIAKELVVALPQTKEEALAQVSGYLETEVTDLGSRLRVIGSKTLAEADSALEEILFGYATCVAQRDEIANLESSGYNPADQQPTLTATEKRLALFEVERKELDSIRIELDEKLAAAQGTKTTLKKLEKLQVLRAITARKIEDLDNLITPLRPPPQQANINPNLVGIPMPPMFIPPPAMASASALVAKEASYV